MAMFIVDVVWSVRDQKALFSLGDSCQIRNAEPNVTMMIRKNAGRVRGRIAVLYGKELVSHDA